ncbi:hypothetical protein [Methylobacterium persicinum]|uniref:Histidine kinase n=1 Tax=Methylobacterium persicinum TaxID=374426 RepID=A0ABU0HRI7_9HYPH|nr:hypothetical protein [Methylobacterium persicinum]MDQ0444101.1 hypothetical protein [Methylobacterium persicinum]GJE38351.1 hypothetical protein KHHGKMAE_2423 [Methylobacterium persicinum]
MGLGYAVALVLESAGLVGLVIGMIRLRAERRARAAELRGLLLTGNAAAAGGIRIGTAHRAPRRVVVDPAPSAVVQDSVAARTALNRALETLRQVERAAA